MVTPETGINRRAEITPAYMKLIKEIEELFFYEANLLDFRQYRAWLDLLEEDMRYFMPLAFNIKYGEWDREYSREGEDVAWFDEGKDVLIRRVRQLETGIHWAEEPPSRQTHILTNITILEITPDIDDPQEIETICRFHAYRNRNEYETDNLVGKRIDRLRKVNNEWKFFHRTLLLDQNVLLEKNMTMFF
jgi:3-phenylpropionate/cinnamic acid dioxygenase small subunit